MNRPVTPETSTLLKPRVWVVEDDETSVLIYREILKGDYQLKSFSSLSAFQTELDHEEKSGGKFPDLVIADLHLTDSSFLKFFESRKLKAQDSVMVVSSIDDIEVLRECYRHGIRDYLIKPFKKAELLVKIERILDDEAPAGSNDPFVFNVDLVSLQVECGGLRSVTLTSKEFQMMSILKSSPEFRVSREDLIQAIWKGLHVSAKTLDVHLFNLRRKLQGVGLAVEFETPSSYRLVKRAVAPVADSSGAPSSNA